MLKSTHIACHECDLFIKIPSVPEGNKALCPRCGYVLMANHYNAQNAVIAYSLTALIFLLLSFQFPFLTFSAQGQDRTVTLLQSMEELISGGFLSLAILIFISTIFIPGLYLISSTYVYSSLKLDKILPYTRTQLKLINRLQSWNMADVFLIGILISFIKIATLAEISLGLSFWSYVVFIITMSAAALNIDKRQAWQWIINKNRQAKIITGHPGNYQSCPVCTEVSRLSTQHCKSCGSDLHPRKKNSLQKTWALLFTTIILYIPANILPIMRTNFLGEETPNTIISGIIILWEQGSYPIAIIILIASVLVPIGKIVALSWLCYNTRTSGAIKSSKLKTQLYRITEFVGKWAMVDVFVVAILVALIQMGNIMSVLPDWGAVAFAAMVIVTIMTALSFDPRLIWDPVKNENAL